LHKKLFNGKNYSFLKRPFGRSFLQTKKGDERLKKPFFTPEEISLLRKRQKFLNSVKPFSLSRNYANIIFCCLHSSNERYRTFSDICDYCGVTERTVRTHLQVLISMGFCSVEKNDGDKRQLKVRLTNKAIILCREFIDLT
jgi:DNA-binding MarR family transcriptional regulator